MGCRKVACRVTNDRRLMVNLCSSSSHLLFRPIMAAQVPRFVAFESASRRVCDPIRAYEKLDQFLKTSQNQTYDCSFSIAKLVEDILGNWPHWNRAGSFGTFMDDRRRFLSNVCNFQGVIRWGVWEEVRSMEWMQWWLVEYKSSHDWDRVIKVVFKLEELTDGNNKGLLGNLTFFSIEMLPNLFSSFFLYTNFLGVTNLCFAVMKM